jgi:hypothetical protein
VAAEAGITVVDVANTVAEWGEIAGDVVDDWTNEADRWGTIGRVGVDLGVFVGAGAAAVKLAQKAPVQPPKAAQ